MSGLNVAKASVPSLRADGSHLAPVAPRPRTGAPRRTRSPSRQIGSPTHAATSAATRRHRARQPSRPASAEPHRHAGEVHIDALQRCRADSSRHRAAAVVCSGVCAACRGRLDRARPLRRRQRPPPRRPAAPRGSSPAASGAAQQRPADRACSVSSMRSKPRLPNSDCVTHARLTLPAAPRPGLRRMISAIASAAARPAAATPLTRAPASRVRALAQRHAVEQPDTEPSPRPRVIPPPRQSRHRRSS